MIRNFTDIAFTDTVKQVQTEQGSRSSYERMEGMEYTELYFKEMDFIQSLDMFYLSTVSETGWPYVQFRGGPKGFLKVLDSKTIGFADFRGNKQYISTGNMTATNKATLILMDYTKRMRLKIWAEAEIVGGDDPKLQEKLSIGDYPAKIERFFIFHVKAYSWNCPQHIVPRFSAAELSTLLENGTIQLSKELLHKLNEMHQEE